jgi:PPM family protein phosphatase
LRGGLDNITVVIARIGEWFDPDSAEVIQQGRTEKNDRHDRGTWRSRLTELVKGRLRNSSLTLVEDHPYRTAECPINEALLERLEDLTRNVQEQAISQAWSLDWTALASLRRQATDAGGGKNQWVSLRKIGEMIALLGQAARFHRKSVTSAQSLD